MEKLISFIVPVYNVEEYVERCILSIVSQDILEDKYELIIVNDGSTDNSLNVLLSLQRKHPFIQIVSTPNGGLSAARNEGLKLASGKYIFFVDSDDWIEEKTLHLLANVIEKREVDIVLFAIKEVFEDNKIKELKSALSKHNVLLPIEEYTLKYTIRSSAWCGLFRRQLFLDLNYQFRKGFLSEDDDFVIKMFSQAKNIISLHINVYNYFQRYNSISNNSNYDSNLKLIGDKVKLLEDNWDYIKQFEGNKYSGLKRKLDFSAVDTIRLIHQKEINKNDQKLFIQSLANIGFYPLPKGKYGYKYDLFRIATSNKLLYFLLSNSPLKKLF